MFEIFGFIIPLIVILVIVGIFLSFVPWGYGFPRFPQALG